MKAFFDEPTSLEYLKRTSLSLQICDHAQRSCEKKRSADGGPLLARLAKGYVQDLVARDLDELLANLHLDQHLDVGAAATQLLCVACELHVRFADYSAYPYALYKLIRKYSPGGYLAARSRQARDASFVDKPESCVGVSEDHAWVPRCCCHGQRRGRSSNVCLDAHGFGFIAALAAATAMPTS